MTWVMLSLAIVATAAIVWVTLRRVAEMEVKLSQELGRGLASRADIEAKLEGLAMAHESDSRRVRYQRDMVAIGAADACVLVLPCGLSTGLEAGLATGRGKRLAVYAPEMLEPELMVKMADLVTDDLAALRNYLRAPIAATAGGA